MKRGVAISVVVLLLVLIAGAIGAYAYDSAHKSEIAEGITIGGVDVGGMTASQAEEAVREEYVAPLRKPITVQQDGTKYVLSAKKLDVQADISATVREAVSASQGSGMPDRLWRYASGGEIDKRIRPEITYSKESLDEFVNTIGKEVYEAPVDASVDPSPSSLNTVPGTPGQELDADSLRRQVEFAAAGTSDKPIEANVDKLQPEVTTKQLAAEYPTYMTVDRATFQLRLYKNLELEKTYTVAVGAEGFDTPVGEYTIQNMAVDPVWSVPDSDWAGNLAGQTIPGGAPNNPLKARWMGIYDGAGIHGTDDTASLGSAASHGCVRMAVPDVIDLYDRVDVGTPIYIG
ncbi:L,D-transpeptidase family protein [Thermoleophilia bacterium SCSIO 60948]|nr:L,D-transpeptidase family protein [Thermoleophilia bacterium SCSIO 60948]